MGYKLPNLETLEIAIRSMSKDRGDEVARARIVQEMQRVIAGSGLRATPKKYDPVYGFTQEHFEKYYSKVRSFSVHDGLEAGDVFDVLMRLSDLHVEFGGDGGLGSVIPGMEAEMIPIGHRGTVDWIDGKPIQTSYERVPSELRAKSFNWGYVKNDTVYWKDSNESLLDLADLLVCLVKGGGLHDTRRNLILNNSRFQFDSKRNKAVICAELYLKLLNKKPKNSPQPRKKQFSDFDDAKKIVGETLKKSSEMKALK